MAKLVTPAEMAARLRIHPSAVSRLARDYNLGTKLNDRMRVYTEEDVMEMQRHSTGVPGRPVRLSESLELSASATEERARQSIIEGNSESAEVGLRLAGHLRRLSTTHEQLGGESDPVQR